MKVYFSSADSADSAERELTWSQGGPSTGPSSAGPIPLWDLRYLRNLRLQAKFRPDATQDRN